MSTSILQLMDMENTLGHLPLEERLRVAAGLLLQLADDLRDGLAKEVITDNPYVVRHPVQARELLPVTMQADAERLAVGGSIFEEHLDHLHLWAIALRTAKCEKTGIRFVGKLEIKGHVLE
jgi:hypothetical protein